MVTPTEILRKIFLWVYPFAYLVYTFNLKKVNFESGLNLCIPDLLFKIPCLTTGITRASSLFLKGDYVGSVNMHIFAAPWILLHLFFFFYYLLDFISTIKEMSQNKSE